MSKTVRGSTIMLVEHFLKVLLGLAFEPDELYAILPIPLPSNDGKRDINWEARAGEFDMQTEMGSDGKLDVAHDLAAADREIGQDTFPGHVITGERDVIIHRHPRFRSRSHALGPLFLGQRAGSNKPNCSSSARVNGMG